MNTNQRESSEKRNWHSTLVNIKKKIGKIGEQEKQENRKNRKNGVVFLQTIVTFLLGMEKGAYLENQEDSD